MKLSTKAEIQEIKDALIKKYKNSRTELNYKNVYELLVAVILSAQCTDKRVNIVTPKLFELYPDISSLSEANLESLKILINSCSFFNTKAFNLIKMAKRVEKKFGGNIPLERSELMTLAGVGQKTAGVVMIEYNHSNIMAVDTHVFRTSHRLGLSKSTGVKKTELDLVEAFGDNLNVLHQAMVLFGRYICTAKQPKCSKCFLSCFCKSKYSFKAN